MVEIMHATPDEARVLTDRIRVGLEATWQLIVEAWEVRAWASLGYSSWDDYCRREFGNQRLQLPREERTEQIQSMREAGMSIRAIASATGAGIGTVHSDLANVSYSHDRGVQNRTPGVEDAEVVDEPVKITGTDGKTYTPRPVPVAVEPEAPAEEPQKRKRRPITDTADELGWELTRLVEKLERLYADDRFDANKEKVASRLRSHLMRATDTLPGLLDQINH